MKPIIPMILALFPLALSAQETPVPTRPQPTPNAVEKAEASSSQNSSRASSRRVVLPPNSRSSGRSATTSRVIPNTSNAASNVRRVSNSHRVSTSPSTLQENVTIQLKGTTSTDDAIDLALTGVGQVFQADVGIGEDDTILTHTYSIVPQGEKYLVEFSIGTRVKIVTSANGPTKNYAFRDNSISGKVILEVGKPVTVSNNQGKVLTLTISKP